MGSRTVIAVMDDVLFISRVQEVAKAQGASVFFAKTPEECLALVNSQPADLVLFDLNARGFDSAVFIDQLSSSGWLKKIRVVGFVRHADEAKIRLIQEKGCQEILPRSTFVKQLPQLLSN